MIRVRNVLRISTIILFAGVFTSVNAQSAHRLSEQEVKNLLDRIEKGTDRFRANVDSALDASRYNGSTAEDHINMLIKAFESATDRLENRFDDHQSAAGLAEEVLKQGVLIDYFMMRHPLTSRAQSDWLQIRGELDRLAQAYQVHWTWIGQMTSAYRVNDKQVESLLERIENDANRFRASLDAALDRSRLDDTNAEDTINQFVKDFEAATDRLEDRFNEKTTASGDVENVLKRAAFIDRFMKRHLLNVGVQSDWSRLRLDLDQLSHAYRVTWNW
jgi:hypothetical protein